MRKVIAILSALLAKFSMEENDPTVSVIIPTKNSSRTLEKCLQSIKDQSYKNIELIVVDNNSADNTKEIAQKFTDKVYNFGPERSAQRNFGAKNAAGKYLLIHDCDIYFAKTSVAECVELAESGVCQTVILPERSIGIGYWAKIKAYERGFYVGNDDIEAPRFFRADMFAALSGYDEQMYAGEDWDMAIRIKQAGYGISRAASFVLHDEGRLSLLASSRKKRYYADNLNAVYAKKHPEQMKRQMSFFVRFPLKTIFVELCIHPIKLASMIYMKGVEYLNSQRT